MDPELLSLLADPVDRMPLVASPDGWLVSSSGGRYPVRRGIPRFVEDGDAGQDQTRDSFGYKWAQRDGFESPAVTAAARAWFLERYGFRDAREMRAHLAGRRLLDLGCGAGYSSALWLGDDEGDPWDGTWVGADISTAVDVARDRIAGPRRHFVQADALALPFRSGTFDAVLSEGVLHHTPSTRAALEAAVAMLAPGGEILFYVYRRKGPIREFTDDHVRSLVAPMPPVEASEALRPLTMLGQALAETGAMVTVPEDVPLLGIPAGTYSVQRLFYWHVAKVFWNETFTFEENHLVNFDWYHPHYAHRQSADEVRGWCDELGLRVTRFQEEDAGFTVRAVREAGRP